MQMAGRDAVAILRIIPVASGGGEGRPVGVSVVASCSAACFFVKPVRPRANRVTGESISIKEGPLIEGCVAISFGCSDNVPFLERCLFNNAHSSHRNEGLNVVHLAESPG